LPGSDQGGALGNWRDLPVSPLHRVALGPLGAPTGFAPANRLARDGDGRFRVTRGRRAVSYVHLLLPKHPVIQAEGVWVESFFPGPVGLAALTLAAKAELFGRFPQFRQDPLQIGRRKGRRPAGTQGSQAPGA